MKTKWIEYKEKWVNIEKKSELALIIFMFSYPAFIVGVVILSILKTV